VIGCLGGLASPTSNVYPIEVKTYGGGNARSENCAATVMP
jgi:hypothetical protein